MNFLYYLVYNINIVSVLLYIVNIVHRKYCTQNLFKISNGGKEIKETCEIKRLNVSSFSAAIKNKTIFSN